MVDGRVHPRVCKLMTGSFNRYPNKQKFLSIWDVEQVLTYIKVLPNSA